MKHIDSESLFNIFSQQDEQIYHEHGISHILDNSFVLFGMVVRGVENYYIIDQLYQRKYQQQYINVCESIKMKYFLGLFKYVNSIADIPPDTVSNIKDEFGQQAIKYALEELIEFFEKVEYYEQCAKLKKYYDIFIDKKLVD